MSSQELSRGQRTALEEFRTAVESIPNKPEVSDQYYLRWLRARKFNVHKSLQMFRKVSWLLPHIQHALLLIFLLCSLAYGVQGEIWV